VASSGGTKTHQRRGEGFVATKAAKKKVLPEQNADMAGGEANGERGESRVEGRSIDR